MCKPEELNSRQPFTQIWTEDSDVNQLTNRLTSSVSYDDAGNVVTDQKFRQLKFQYDANNRQKQSSNLDDSGVVKSVYDAGGQRVATQIAGALTNVLVYDAMGKLVAEYGSSSTANGTQYVMSDHQGSTRAVMNNAGAVVSRHDYLPFGEEVYANVGMRSTGQDYNVGDGVRQRYAGMETDDATGMAHTLWRNYDSLSGRWTAPDPYGGSMTVADPQSFNRYSYVNNDPANHVDPSGLMLSDIGVYQTDNPQDAQIAEHQSLRELQTSVNSDYAARNGGSVSYNGSHATFTPQNHLYSTNQFSPLYRPNAAGAHVTVSAFVGDPQKSAAPRRAEWSDPTRPCSGIFGFNESIGIYSGSELNDAVITDFGELGARTFSLEEALAIGSEIFNRSMAIANGTAEKTWGNSSSLSSVVTARAQFAGYAAGIATSAVNGEWNNGQRNCRRMQLAFSAVGRIASDLTNGKGTPYPYTYNYSNFGGRRPLGDGEVRIGGNDFSTMPMKGFRP